jgi:hypothetical protein
MEKPTAKVMEKFRQVRWFIAQTIKERNAYSAEVKLVKAKKMIREVETQVLANPFVTDTAIANLVRFLRAPLWSQAECHVASLKAS